MATDVNENDDLLRLHALVDGELAPDEQAALAGRLATDRDFARAYATLARLKACIAESAEAQPPVTLPAAKPKRSRALGFGLAAAAAALVAAASVIELTLDRQPQPLAIDPISVAALPLGPVIPDFRSAGLTLASVTADTTDSVIAIYKGPRGCRIELRVRPQELELFPGTGTSHRTWTVDGLTYQLVAFGMPPSRFEAIASAAERMSRERQLPRGMDRLLREARSAATPCVA